MSFRFETHQNVVLKGDMKSATWKKAAMESLFGDKRIKNDIVSISSINQDEIVFVRRLKNPAKRPLFYYAFSRPNLGVYERVTVNRKTHSVAIDRMDKNVNFESSYIGVRDLFYEGKSPTETVGSSQKGEGVIGLTMVRHLFWVPKPAAFLSEACFTLAKKKYNRQFSG